MKWLQTILENAVITDGKLDVAAVMATIKKTFPEHAVPKTTFNEVKDQLTAANDTITGLKKDHADNAALQDQIKKHEATITQLQADAKNDKLSYALKDELRKLGAMDPEYLIYKHGGLEKFTFNDEGKPVDLKDTVKAYKEELGHLFIKDHANYEPRGGGDTPPSDEAIETATNLAKQKAGSTKSAQDAANYYGGN